MKKFVLFICSLFLSLSAYAFENATFCFKDGHRTSTIALHPDGTSEWTKQVYGHGEAPCGIDPNHPTYLKGTYSMDPVTQSLHINYPPTSLIPGPQNYDGRYAYANQKVQELYMTGEFGGTFVRMP